MHLRSRHVVGANQRGLLGSSGSPWGLCCALGIVHTPEVSEGRCCARTWGAERGRGLGLHPQPCLPSPGCSWGHGSRLCAPPPALLASRK